MKIVIYTVVTGNYDILRQPLVIDNRFSYVCFTDKKKESLIGVWEIRNIPFEIEDKQRLSRYPKLKPHELLQDFDFSIYMDANLVIAKTDFYQNILRLVNNNVNLAGVKNGWRDCLYEEGFRCILSRLDSIKKIIYEMRLIKSDKFPKNFGMYEANIIFRNHHDETIINQSNMWWHIVTNNAKRDQLCFSYTMWKNNIDWNYVFPDESNTHNNPSINFHEHPHKTINKKKLTARKLFKWTNPFLKLIYNIAISIPAKNEKIYRKS